MLLPPFIRLLEQISTSLEDVKIYSTVHMLFGVINGINATQSNPKMDIVITMCVVGRLIPYNLH